MWPRQGGSVTERGATNAWISVRQELSELAMTPSLWSGCCRRVRKAGGLARSAKAHHDPKQLHAPV